MTTEFAIRRTGAANSEHLAELFQGLDKTRSEDESLSGPAISVKVKRLRLSQPALYEFAIELIDRIDHI
jgi:hypothetical protein